MNKKIYIKQDRTIPAQRIIEELERRGGNNLYERTGVRETCYIINCEGVICSNSKSPEGYTELLYNKETDTFYEKNESSDSINSKGCINCNKGDMKETYCGEKSPSAQEAAENKELSVRKQAIEMLEQRGFHAIFGKYGLGMQFNIPEGYEANIEDGKVIVTKKKWQPKIGDKVWNVEFRREEFDISCDIFDEIDFIAGAGLFDFPTKKEAVEFCDELNNAIKPILEERRKEVGG